MVNIFDVAKYILHTHGGEISTMKLQKLCYYAQAWTLVWTKKPLFEEDFLRWDNGPVCRELFNEHKGRFVISEQDISEKLFSGNEFSYKEMEYIEQILDELARHTGAQLSDMTHQEDPWLKTAKDEIIDKKAIEKYYSEM